MGVALGRCLHCLLRLPRHEVLGSVHENLAPQSGMPDEGIPQSLAVANGLQDQPATIQDQIATFVQNGFFVLEIPERDVAASVHKSIYRQVAPLGFGKFGDNILPEIPELYQVITANKVTEALEGLLGPDYCLHRHRWLHVSGPQGEQSWHKDGNNRRMRSHRTRAIKVMYFPQDTVVEMGPTAVLPGSQYANVDHNDESKEVGCHNGCAEDVLSDGTQAFFWKPGSEKERDRARLARAKAVKSLDPSLKEHLVTPVKAGSVMFMHDDLIHRGTADTRGKNKQSQQPRCMIKFLFLRVRDPQPDSLATICVDGPEHMKHMQPVHQEMLRWYGARMSGLAPAVSSAELESLKVDLRSDSEPARIVAAYILGSVARHTDMPELRKTALAYLAGAMRHNRESARRSASFGFMTAGPEGVELALEMLGGCCEPKAARKYLLRSLGEAGVASEDVVNCIINAIKQKAGEWSDMAILEKSAAVSALGLLGAQTVQDDIFFRVCGVLTTAANDKSEKAVGDEFLVRQAAAFALLQVCAAAPKEAAALDSVQQSLAELLGNKDRYALGFAAEALLTLAKNGSLKAEQVLRNFFAEELANEELADEDGTGLARLVRCQRQKI